MLRKRYVLGGLWLDDLSIVVGLGVSPGMTTYPYIGELVLKCSPGTVGAIAVPFDRTNKK